MFKSKFVLSKVARFAMNTEHHHFAQNMLTLERITWKPKKKRDSTCADGLMGCTPGMQNWCGCKTLFLFSIFFEYLVGTTKNVANLDAVQGRVGSEAYVRCGRAAPALEFRFLI